MFHWRTCWSSTGSGRGECSTGCCCSPPGHDEEQRRDESVPPVQGDAHQAALQRAVGGPEHIRKTVAEAVGQHGGLAAQAHNVGHRGHDGHGDGGLAGRAVDEEIDEALKYQHTDGGKHRV